MIYKLNFIKKKNEKIPKYYNSYLSFQINSIFKLKLKIVI